VLPVTAIFSGGYDVDCILWVTERADDEAYRNIRPVWGCC
jgi:hypothetical protein